MRALAKTRPGPGLELIEVDEPVPGPSDIVVAPTHAAICGTDLHIYTWDDWAVENVEPPRVLGHEFVGTVVAIGDRVVDLEVGTRVAGEGHVVCGRCRNCRGGRRHLCPNTKGVGIHRDGGFADRVVIPAANAYPIPDGIADEVAAVLDPLGNATHTALSFDLVAEDVLITGAGPIGLMAAAICRHAGARHVVVTDVHPNRLAIATAMGATLGVEAGVENLRAAMEKLGMTEGFDVALEMSGSPKALDDMIDVVTHGAKIGLLGLFAGPAEVDMNEIIMKGLTTKGIYGRRMFETWYKATSMLQTGLDITPVISHRFPLEEWEVAFEALKAGEATKIVLEL